MFGSAMDMKVVRGGLGCRLSPVIAKVRVPALASSRSPVIAKLRVPALASSRSCSSLLPELYKGSLAERLNLAPKVYRDNFWKREELFVAYEGFYIEDLDLGPLKRCGGCLHPVSPDEEDVQDAAQSAVEVHNTQKNTNVKLVRVVRATIGSNVTGLMLRITLEASDNCFYEAQVRRNFFSEIPINEVYFVRPAKYYRG